MILSLSVTKYWKQFLHFLLEEEYPDDDGLYDGLLLPEPYCKFLYKTSWLSLYTGFYALYRNYYDLALIPLGVWFHSIRHWIRPHKHSRERMYDVSFAWFGLFYQLYRAYDAENRNIYYGVVAIGGLCYPLSFYFQIQNKVRLSTYIHSMVHILGNVSNIILYSGECRRIISD
jgi:hypothetical protein